MNSNSLIDEQFNKDYEKYVREWSDEEFPITVQEASAYRAGWHDCHARSVKRTEG